MASSAIASQYTEVAESWRSTVEVDQSNTEWISLYGATAKYLADREGAKEVVDATTIPNYGNLSEEFLKKSTFMQSGQWICAKTDDTGKIKAALNFLTRGFKGNERIEGHYYTCMSKINLN